jgi:hypothetical protein
MPAETKDAVNVALKMIMKLDPNVTQWFDLMVDTRSYSDYLLMVEAPMFLGRIQQRLQNNYYTNKNSVVADMELIKENCYKYNEDNNEFYDLACQMFEKFRLLIDAILDPPADDDSSESEDTIIRRGAYIGHGAGAASANRDRGSSPAGARTRRHTRAGRVLQPSALANLPHPVEPARVLRTTRSSGARNLESNHQEESPAENEDEHASASQSEDEESDDERMPSRSTRASYSVRPRHRSSPERTEPAIGVRTSTRARSKTSYTEKDSDGDEYPEPRRSTTRRQRSAQVDSDEDSEEEVKPRSRKSSRKSSPSKPSPSKPSTVSNGVGVRVSSRTRGKLTYTEIGSDEEEEPPRHTRASNRRQPAQPRGRSSSRNARSRSVLEDHREYDDHGQASDSYNESEAEESEDQVSSRPKPKLRLRVGKQTGNHVKKEKSPDKPASPVRTSSRSRAAKSYVEKASDEEEYYESSRQSSDEDEVSDEAVSSDKEVATPKKKRSRTQPESPYSDSSSPKKKRGRTSPGSKGWSILMSTTLLCSVY